MHKRVRWSPSSTEKGTRRGEGSRSVGSPVRISKCPVSLFYQKSIKGLRNQGSIVEVTLLDMIGSVVTIMKPRKVTPSFISRELTCTCTWRERKPREKIAASNSGVKTRMKWKLFTMNHSLKLKESYLFSATLKKPLSKSFHHSTNQWTNTIDIDSTMLLKFCPREKSGL